MYQQIENAEKKFNGIEQDINLAQAAFQSSASDSQSLFDAYQISRYTENHFNVNSASALQRQVTILSSVNCFLNKQPEKTDEQMLGLQWHVNNDELHSQVLNLTSQIISRLDPNPSGSYRSIGYNPYFELPAFQEREEEGKMSGLHYYGDHQFNSSFEPSFYLRSASSGKDDFDDQAENWGERSSLNYFL